MTVHFHREMELVKAQILRLGTMAEEQLYYAIRAVEEFDEDLAHKVIIKDDLIDQKEVEIEEDCLKVMALHQPVAIDLRLLVSVMKINSDLERVGDTAVNIAETVSFLKANQDPVRKEFEFSTMAEKVRILFRRSLDSLINLDEKEALEVCSADDEIDAMHRNMYQMIEEKIQKKPAQVGVYLRYLLISRNLERVGDHATNIAEDVLYMVRGRIFRHTHEDDSQFKE
ncbi:MAG TPA: phosphate signaling complex protein PhoU [Fibrobacteraceae bacterium]|nr:phosphate signaling complex protein PhoU [Fibrobacteraceae bacterium]